jgi:peptide/nickel transport system ATP-binding protein
MAGFSFDLDVGFGSVVGSTDDGGPGGRAIAPADVARGAPFVRLDGLETYYDEGPFADPVRAVDGVDLTIRKGETVGLVGESGCGKTTLGRTLVGLESATGGRVLVDGTDVTGLSGAEKRAWQRDAAIVFQDPGESLDDRMTVGEIVREPLDAHGRGTPAERRERVFEFLGRVGLQEEHYYRYPHQFSGGQRQRVGIARALVLEPSFLVLDEPVSALDVSVQGRIINLLRELQSAFDLTYLFIAHDLSVVRHIADRVAVMYLGTVVETGPTDRVFADPRHPYTAALLSAIPGETVRDGVGVTRTRLRLQGQPPNPRDPPPGCPFATRCPAKIRPDGADLAASEAVWTAVDEFRVLLRERARRDDSAVATVARRLGLSADDAVDEAVAELFGEHEIPPAVDRAIDRAVELAAAGRDRQAARHLRDELGTVCDDEQPDAIAVGDGRGCRCHRATDEYDDTATVLDRRFPDDEAD